jgi:hypothetical protein
MRVFTVCFLLLLVLVSATSAANNTITLARGEELVLPLPIGLTNHTTYWLFSDYGMDHYYDLPILLYQNNSAVIILEKNQTKLMAIGDYTVAIQTVGKNEVKEVGYKQKDNIISPVKDEFLVSPFKDIQDIDINGLSPSVVLTKLKMLINQSIDDKLTFMALTVEEPVTIIKGLNQLDNETAEIYGTSNLNIGTYITIYWDIDRLVSAEDYRKNTFHAVIVEGNNNTHIWSTKMHLNDSIQQLPVGKHWIDVVVNERTSRIGFDVLEIYKNQTPPPMAKIKYLGDGNIAPPDPIIIEKPVPVEVRVIETVIQPTPNYPKNAMGKEYNPYLVPDMTGIMYLGIILGIISVITGGIIWNLK